MRAVVIEEFGVLPRVVEVPEPACPPHGAVIRVEATGVCRSDWHAWQGHDGDVRLPHVPGHELAGTIAAVGADVRCFRVGDRVTVPFVSGCGRCEECHSGNQHVCSHQFQPGFTHFGSFAEYVGIHYADTNLVHLPEELDFATAASLGCRFATSFRAIVDQGRARGGEWVAVHGCGGVGLAAIMIASALHGIAFGNMLPAYVGDSDDTTRPLTVIAVDSSEFVVSKLKDRGTHQAFGVITNAQDFLHVLRHFVEQAEPTPRSVPPQGELTPAHV